ncbi:hypothetical protein [Dysgonomonas sp.]
MSNKDNTNTANYDIRLAHTIFNTKIPKAKDLAISIVQLIVKGWTSLI